MHTFEQASKQEINNIYSDRSSKVSAAAQDEGVSAQEIKNKVVDTENTLRSKVTDKQDDILGDIQHNHQRNAEQMKAKQYVINTEDNKRFRLFSKDPMFGKAKPTGD